MNRKVDDFIYPLGTCFRIYWPKEDVTEQWAIGLQEPPNGFEYLSPDSDLAFALRCGKTSYKVERYTCRFEILEIIEPEKPISESTMVQRSNQLETYRKLAEAAIRDTFRKEVKQKVPRLSKKDIELAMLWANKESANKPDKTVVEKMKSARTAEVAVRDFFEMQGYKVDDISIQQLDKGKNNDWAQYDLLVDQVPVDVKNSRRRNKRSNIFVRHYVPRFKRQRNRDVEIIGVLTDIVKETEWTEAYESVTILGNTSIARINGLIDFFSSENLTVNFSDRDTKSEYHLPPWVFNYPSDFYLKREQVLSELSRYSDDLYDLALESGFNPISILLACGIGLPKYRYEPLSLMDWEKQLFRVIRQTKNEAGLSLPHLFLTILSHFLTMLAFRKTYVTSFHPRDYRKLIFIRDNDSANPLFIYDPLRTIDSLISLLEKIWGADAQIVGEYDQFRLVSSGILKGLKKGASKETTLFAYCGGCGNAPLVIGNHQTCPGCRMLICNRCNTCWEGCEEYRKRNADRFEKVNSRFSG